jgi:hydrogenase maturation protease
LRTLIIGIGNRYRRDDGAGCAVASRLHNIAGAGVRVITPDDAGGALMDLWSDADRVFAIDAARSGAAPGTIHRFDAVASPLPTGLLHPHSTHGFGLAESIELARALDRLPPQLIVYAIAGEGFDPGVGLTPDVQRAADEVARRIQDEIAVTARL